MLFVTTNKGDVIKGTVVPISSDKIAQLAPEKYAVDQRHYGARSNARFGEFMGVQLLANPVH